MTTHETPERRLAASNLYVRIVVALDGSARAELVLPYVEALAEQFGSSMTLLRATTPAGANAAPAAATMPPLAPNAAATPIDPTVVVAAERREVESYLRARAASAQPWSGGELSTARGSGSGCDRRASE